VLQIPATLQCRHTAGKETFMFTNKMKTDSSGLRMPKKALPMLLVAAVMAVTGCNSKADPAANLEIAPPVQTASAPPAVRPAPRPCYSCGVITSINAVKDEGKNTHVGLVLGAIIGGVAGNKIGNGKSATAAGAVVGGYAGNEIEKNNKKDEVKYYRVGARMQDGHEESVKVNSSEGLFVGQKIRIEDGNISLR
jgi:uncharacterized protein YcfJ